MSPRREVGVGEIERAVAELSREANYGLPRDVREALGRGLAEEESPLGREILEMLLENARIASAESVPLCQDTGLAVVFIDIGQDVCLTGGDLREAVNKGVARGYEEGYLRKSVVADPFRRRNTGDNTPAVLHLDIVPGDRLRIVVLPKGGGSENMSALRMLKPADGLEGVKSFVVDTVLAAGPNPCPPVVVGVGVGGDLELSALLAKKALLRPLGRRHTDKFYADMEADLLLRINREGIGPMGMGGRLTALDVHVECHPCHMASLPAAVNLSCHSVRHREIVI